MTALRKNDPARMFRPVDLSRPGALDNLLSLHRQAFGDLQMVDPPADPPTDPPADPPVDPPTYTAPATQADLDRIIGDRVARERAKFADYADIKAKAEAHDKALADAMTEQEKAVAAARAEGETAAQAAANTRIIRAEARAIAAEAKALNPAVVLAAIDLSDVKVGDDGEVDAKAIKTKLDDLAKTDPYLFDDGKGKSPKPDRSQGGGGGGDDKQGTDRGREMFAASRSKKSA